MEWCWEVVKLDHPYASISVKDEPDIESLQTELIIKEEIKEEYEETSDKYLSSVMNLESELIIKEELKDEYDEISNQYLGSDINLEHAFSNKNFDGTRNVHDDFNIQFICKHCGAIFKSEADVTKHLRNPETLCGKKCGKKCTISPTSNYKITQNEHEFINFDLKPIKAEYDETTNKYSGPDMKLEHAVSNANFDDKRNVNKYLKRQFGCKHYVEMLNNERYRKNGIDSMFCDRTITQREYQFLKSKSKPFKCTTCDKVFSNELSVMAHNIKEHVGEKCFTCPDCKQIFSERNDLLSHNIKLHPSDKRQKLHIKWRRRNNNQFLYKRPRPYNLVM